MKTTFSTFNAMGQAEFASILGAVFEHSPWIAERAWQSRPFFSLKNLYEVMCGIVKSAPPEAQLRLIRAHPDLAGKLAKMGQLTSESTGEQAAAGLGALTPEELETFDRRNRAYREKFGFPFVICARLSNKTVILDAFARRLENNQETEMQHALGEIYKIAWLRLEAFA
jgi:2-oxo-4-hydroxy-4-carboxy-5-ureidoimidazoline decarboxylase